MTPKEKKLLEIELSTRSQYGVICAIKPVAAFHDLPFSGRHKIKNVCIREDDTIFHFGPYEVHGVENIRPYLRPMSSMTEEEEDELNSARMGNYGEDVDWLNTNHFDYHGLIPMGLALEAPEDMYKKPKKKPEVQVVTWENLGDKLAEIAERGLENAHTVDFSKEYENSKKILEKKQANKAVEKEVKTKVPKTIEEAVSMLDKLISEEDKIYLKKNGAISVHSSLGRWIRNNWGLWEKFGLYDCLHEKGFYHPDDMSNYVIEEFIKTLPDYE